MTAISLKPYRWVGLGTCAIEGAGAFGLTADAWVHVRAEDNRLHEHPLTPAEAERLADGDDRGLYVGEWPASPHRLRARGEVTLTWDDDAVPLLPGVWGDLVNVPDVLARVSELARARLILRATGYEGPGAVAALIWAAEQTRWRGVGLAGTPRGGGIPGQCAAFWAAIAARKQAIDAEGGLDGAIELVTLVLEAIGYLKYRASAIDGQTVVNLGPERVLAELEAPPTGQIAEACLSMLALPGPWESRPAVAAVACYRALMEGAFVLPALSEPQAEYLDATDRLRRGDYRVR